MSAETRTTSATGGQKGVKDERHDLIPREGLEAIARVYAFGAEKYADHNWRKGYEWSKSYAALMRHMVAFWSGETYDEESGLPHLAHAGFHIMALLTWLEQDGEGSQFDDRYVTSERVRELTEQQAEELAVKLFDPKQFGFEDEPPPPPPAATTIGPAIPNIVVTQGVTPTPNAVARMLADGLQRDRRLNRRSTM